jgi:NADH:ubiquinone oxidoreductase subunit 6 (subunit J)
MVGLMQIMIYMLAVYLVFKGVEIFQIAFMSTRQNRTWGMLIGGVFVLIALAVGIGFSVWADLQAASISDRMNNIPNLQR